jgi:hypothetical protein
MPANGTRSAFCDDRCRAEVIFPDRMDRGSRRIGTLVVHVRLATAIILRAGDFSALIKPNRHEEAPEVKMIAAW